MAALHVSDIAQMRDLLEQLFLKMGECTGRVSLAKLLQLSEQVEEGIFSTSIFTAKLDCD